MHGNETEMKFEDIKCDTKFVCTQCGLKFARNSHLIIHILEVTQVKSRLHATLAL